MSTRKLLLIGVIVLFIAALVVALLRELNREEQVLAASINGVVEVDDALAASGQVDLVRTDRLVLMLVDPATREPVALTFESPLVPPQTIRIGQAQSRDGKPLTGPYLVVGITDKDGEIYKVTAGEIYGRSPEPVPLGTEQYHLVLDQPFRGSLFNEPGAAPPVAQAAGAPPAGTRPPMAMPQGDADPRYSIAGTLTVKQGLQGTVEPSDRLIILMFDPDLPQPVSFKIIPHTLLPQRFTITLPPEARAAAKPGYSLRIVTDKDNNPFGSAPGELVGRSPQPVPLGTTELAFELDQPYVR